MSILLRFDDDKSAFAVVIDDDDRVAYAYLLANDTIVGDVWLYNKLPAPEHPDFNKRSNAPFLNSKEYVADNNVLPICNSTLVAVVWLTNGGSSKLAEIYTDGALLAVLAAGARPGWCRNAGKNGPLARTLGGRPRTKIQ